MPRRYLPLPRAGGGVSLTPSGAAAGSAAMGRSGRESLPTMPLYYRPDGSSRAESKVAVPRRGLPSRERGRRFARPERGRRQAGLGAASPPESGGSVSLTREGWRQAVRRWEGAAGGLPRRCHSTLAQTGRQGESEGLAPEGGGPPRGGPRRGVGPAGPGGGFPPDETPVSLSDVSSRARGHRARRARGLAPYVRARVRKVRKRGGGAGRSAAGRKERTHVTYARVREVRGGPARPPPLTNRLGESRCGLSAGAPPPLTPAPSGGGAPAPSGDGRGVAPPSHWPPGGPCPSGRENSPTALDVLSGRE
jgi:hypothetical protein